MPRFNHYCSGCVFIGKHKEFDVYICGNRKDRRSIILRYGNEGFEYKSGSLFECVTLTDIDKFCLFNGLELNEKEEKRLLKVLCYMFKEKLSFDDYKKHCSEELVLGKGNVMFEEIN